MGPVGKKVPPQAAPPRYHAAQGRVTPPRTAWGRTGPAVRRGLPDSRWWWAGAIAPVGVLHLAAGNDNFTQFVDSM